ncbi:MAG: hypothetical protein M3384_11270 [Acidobacteriota bacterium]|nr:hypothetical protein [Acidobacteriota bacterium]
MAFITVFAQGVSFAQQSTPTSQPSPSPARRTAQQQQQSFDLTEYGVKIEPDRRLIVVLASLEAAGLDTPLSEAGEQFRKQLRTDFQSLNPDLQQKLKVFLDQYIRRFADRYKQTLGEAEKRDFTDFIAKYRQGLKDEEKKIYFEKYKRFLTELTSSFVSLAYALSPVPELQDPPRSVDLPAELLEVFDYAPLVREFYRRSGISARLDDYLKEYQKAGDTMRGSASVMVRDLLDYLHTRPQLSYIDRVKVETKDAKGKNRLEKTEARQRERRFFIVPDLLAPAGTINFRNVGDDYYVVVPPNTNLRSSEARRAFLQFTIDPLILQNGREIAGFREGIKALLDERRKANPDISPDVYLAVLRSMVAAVDARQIEFVKTQAATFEARRKIDLAQGDAAKRAVSAELARLKTQLADETALELSESYERGAVLAFYFAEQLKGTEDSGFDVAGSFRDFILSLDPAKEANRLTQFDESRRRAVAAREERRKRAAMQQVTTTAELTPREKALNQKLQQIEQVIKAKDYEKADEQLSELMKDYQGDARVLYARGRVASLSAELAFDETVRDERLQRAATHYRMAISNSDPENDRILKQRAHVALARILEFNEQMEAAAAEYEAAVKLGNIDAPSYNEALAAKQRLAKKP